MICLASIDEEEGFFAIDEGNFVILLLHGVAGEWREEGGVFCVGLIVESKEGLFFLLVFSRKLLFIFSLSF